MNTIIDNQERLEALTNYKVFAQIEKLSQPIRAKIAPNGGKVREYFIVDRSDGNYLQTGNIKDAMRFFKESGKLSLDANFMVSLSTEIKNQIKLVVFCYQKKESPATV